MVSLTASQLSLLTNALIATFSLALACFALVMLWRSRNQYWKARKHAFSQYVGMPSREIDILFLPTGDIFYKSCRFMAALSALLIAIGGLSVVAAHKIKIPDIVFQALMPAYPLMFFFIGLLFLFRAEAMFQIMKLQGYKRYFTSQTGKIPELAALDRMKSFIIALRRLGGVMAIYGSILFAYAILRSYVPSLPDIHGFR